MEKVSFFYNPISGEGLIISLLDELIALHQKHGYALTPYRLVFSPDQDKEIISLLDDSIHHILLAGGDGTVNYMVNLMKRNGLDIPIAMLPAGTANDFAMLFDISSDPIKACEKILTGQVREVDLGVVNGQYFVNVFSCGLFSDISQKTPTMFKNTFGRLAYYVSGLGDLPKFRRMHLKLESDGGSYEGPSLMFFVFNGRTAGKLRIAYLSSVEDGLLDVLIIRGDNPAEAFQAILHYLAVTATKAMKKYPSGITHIRCSHLTAEAESPEISDVDGQAGPIFPIEIVCEKASLKVLAPRPKVKKKR